MKPRLASFLLLVALSGTAYSQSYHDSGDIFDNKTYNQTFDYISSEALTSHSAAPFTTYTDINSPYIIDDFFQGPIIAEKHYVNFNTPSYGDMSIRLDGTDCAFIGMNINVYNTYNGAANASYGIYSDEGLYITVGAADGTYSTITTSSQHKQTYGIQISNRFTQQSHIYNTKIYSLGNRSTSINASNSLLLHNVHCYMEPTVTSTNSGYGIYAGGDNTYVTNKDSFGNVLGPVTITANEQATVKGAIASHSGAVVDLANVTIDIHKGGLLSGGGSGSGHKGTLILTDSTLISRSEHNNLIDSTNIDGSSYTLDNVKILSDSTSDAAIAKNQRIYVSNIYASAPVTVDFIKTDFHGYTELEKANRDSLHISLSNRSSWTVSANSALGINGKVTLDSSSMIRFMSNGSDFMNINTAMVMLAEDSVLRLDKDSSVFQANDIITLFTGSSGADYINDGTLLITEDNIQLDYIDLNDGRFQLTGEMTIVDPDPETPDIDGGNPVTPAPEQKTIAPEYMGTLVMNSLWSSASNVKMISNAAEAQMGIERLHLNKNTNYWISALGDFTNHRSNGSIDGYEYSGGGYAVGADTFLTDRFLMGAAFGHLIGTNKSKDYNAEIDQTTLGGILYGAWFKPLNNASKDLVSISGTAAYGNTNNKMDTWFRDGSCTKGKWDNNTWRLSLKGTWDHNLRNNWTLSPYIAIEYTHAQSKAFNEDNIIGNKARRFDKGDMKNLSLPIGLGIGKVFDCGNGIKWNHNLTVSYVPDVYRHNPESPAMRISNGQTWMTQSSRPARNSMRVDYGTRVQWNPTWATFAGYELETGSGFIYHRATLGVSAAF